MAVDTDVLAAGFRPPMVRRSLLRYASASSTRIGCGPVWAMALENSFDGAGVLAVPRVRTSPSKAVGLRPQSRHYGRLLVWSHHRR
jgi:hypothetical protein